MARCASGITAKLAIERLKIENRAALPGANFGMIAPLFFKHLYWGKCVRNHFIWRLDDVAYSAVFRYYHCHWG